MCLGRPHLLRAMPARLLSARGSVRNGVCFAFALEKAVGGVALVLFERVAGSTGSPSESFQSQCGPWMWSLQGCSAFWVVSV